MIKPRGVCIYGVSDTGKTSQAYHIAKWVLSKPENKGKKFRLISSDGGGWLPFEDSGMIKRGEVEVFDFGALREGVLARFRWLADGYWPRYTTSGQVYFFKDEKCKTTPEQFNNIAGYIIEGIESTCEALKNHCSDQTEGIGFKESWRYEEEGEVIVGLQQGHYGIIQKEFSKAHHRGFNCLPVPWLIYTSKLGRGEDKQNRETVYGPQIVGNAVTSSAPGWFMDVLHMSTEKYIDKNEKDVIGLVAWFRKHLDADTGVPYLAKARCMPERYLELLARFPNGFVPIGFKRGLDVYFEVLEGLRGAND